MNYKIGFKSIAVILGLITWLFQSCSMEKRYHSSGYSFSVFDKIASSKSKNSLKNNSNSFKKKSPFIQNNHSLSEGTVSHPSIDRNRTSSTIKTNATQLVQQNKSTQKCTSSEGQINHSATIIQFATKTQSGDEQVKFTSPINKLQVQANNASRGSNVLLGILLLIAAAYFFWNISMLIGVILFFIALFVMSSGKSKNRNKKDNSEDSDGKMVDVVYLKNGSVITGSIIEQIPNETIKIQTRDGSVFVYQYSDISRMTKEKR